METKREIVRSVFISDLHLGCTYCKSDMLLNFLKNIQPENLYLVGDIIDGWKMKQKIYWNDDYSFIVRRIIGMIKNDTKIIYITGNHDEFLREFCPNVFGHFSVVDEVIHETLDGRKILVIHGDIFDNITSKLKFLYFLGDKAYTFAMWLNHVYNYIRIKFKMPYWSLSSMLKQNVKKAVNFINDFEKFIVDYTKNKNCDGVICGHIHTPVIKELNGITYYNCGDWVESCTAIIEHLDGSFELRKI